MRKRSKYRPKPVIANPIEFVITGNNPITKHDSYLVDRKLINHNAMTCVLRGEATKAHINALIAMHNICEAIRKMIASRKITDLPILLDSSTLIRGKAALLELASRGSATGHWVCKAPEIQALNDLMQLHDEMMELITVRHLEMAIAFANNEVACNRTTVINDYVVQHA